MDKRPLGNTGMHVAPLALGGNVFGWTADERASFDVLDAFVAGGFDLIDTANSYSRWVSGHHGGESESVIGRWIAKRGRHDDVVIATKVGSDMGLGRKCLRREHIIEQAEASLGRLKVERIDLYQSHWDDPDTYVRRLGKPAFVKALTQAKPLSQFLFSELASQVDMATDEGRARFLAQATFGPTTAEIAHLRSAGYATWFNEQFLSWSVNASFANAIERLSHDEQSQIEESIWELARDIEVIRQCCRPDDFEE